MVAQFTTGRVSRDQRFTRHNPCPICGGGDGDKRGRGVRCYGYLSADERYAYCTNSDFAGTLSQRPNSNAYKHRIAGGPCNCGEDHAAGYRVPPLRRASASDASDTPAKITRSHIGRAPADYTHDYGENLRLLRWGSGKDKRLCWQHFNRDHGWIDGQGPYAPSFYRAEAVRNADARKPVYLAGGEKCVDALVKVGAVAGCNPGGEGPGKWRDEWNALFVGRHVVILADADDTGRAHAHAIADSLAGGAASVRQIELESAHDVADWLADGHTYGDLLEITACTLPDQYSNPAMQDGRGTGTQENIICLNCARERDMRQIAETSLANLRREQAMAGRILALPKEQLTPPLKPAAIAVREILSQPKARDDQGMEQVYRRAISQRCGVSDQTAGTYLRKLAQAGIIRRDVRKSFDTTEIHISEGPLWNDPEQIEPAATTWGGQRTKPGCPHCQSPDIEPTSYGCHNCGAHLRPDELIPVLVAPPVDGEGDVSEASVASPETMPSDARWTGGMENAGHDAPTAGAPRDARPATQDQSPPPDTIVTHLASDAQDTPTSHRERADVRRMAEALGWPRVQITQGAWTGGNPETWERFTVGNPPERIDAAYAALLTLASQEAVS